MNRQHLKIDFIDESVNFDDFKASDLMDYIGSVRIGLQKMLRQDKYEDDLDIVNMDKKVMGRVRVALKYIDVDSPEAYTLMENDREVALKSHIIQKKVKHTIVQTMVEFDLPSIEIVFDMLFTAERINANREINVETTFKEWILKDIKVPVSDRDLTLFVKAYPELCRQSGFVDKEDLILIFGDTYRQLQFDFIEKGRIISDMKMDSLIIDAPEYDLSVDRSQRAMNQDYYRNMATTPQFAQDRISNINGKSGVVDDTQDISMLKYLGTKDRLL